MLLSSGGPPTAEFDIGGVRRLVLPPAEALLREGGDTRLALDPVSGRNRYGCASRPDPGLGHFGSATASTISPEGYAAADALRTRLAAMQERDRIYANPDATDDDYMKAAELEGKFAEYGGYDAEARAAQMKLLAERFSRSLLSFLAPIIALLGVSLTTRLTNWFALPLSCVVLMSVNLLCEWVITTGAPVSVAGAVLPVLLLYGAGAVIAFNLVVWRHSDLVRPQLGRS